MANRHNTQQTVSQTLIAGDHAIEEYRREIPNLQPPSARPGLALFDAGMSLAKAVATERVMSEKYALKLLLGLCTAENLKNMHANYIEWFQGGIEAAGNVLGQNAGLNDSVKDLPRSIESLAASSQKVFNELKTRPFYQALGLYREIRLLEEIAENVELTNQHSTDVGRWFIDEKRNHPLVQGEQRRDRLFVHAMRGAVERPDAIEWDTPTPVGAARRWPKGPGLARYQKFSVIRTRWKKIRAACKRLSLLIKGFGNHWGVLLLFSDVSFRTA